MTRRRILALAALLVFVALAGCFGSSELPEDELTENASYDWNTSANATFNISRSSYTAVVAVPNESIEVWRTDTIEGETPVQLRALQYRYPNGTVVNASHENLSASTDGDRTTIEMPADEGKVAYTASRSGKSFATPVFVNGSHEVILPSGARVGIPLLSQSSPGDMETSVQDNRQTLRWEGLTDQTISVRYYLQRDLLLFGGLGAVGLLLAIGGSIYYIRQIRTLEKQREDIGPDIDYDDDEFDDDPPPGMR
jgi:hypothetical protein